MRLLLAILCTATVLQTAHAATDQSPSAKNIPATKNTALGVVLDNERAILLARTAASEALYRFTGRCYQYVGDDLEIAGFIEPSGWKRLGIGTADAIDFARWGVSNKETMFSELGLIQIPTPANYEAIPTGSIMVFEPGFCGYDSTSGHIAIVTPDRSTCSDGCEDLDAIYRVCVSNEDSLGNIYIFTPARQQ